MVDAHVPESVECRIDTGSVALAEHALGLFDGVERAQKFAVSGACGGSDMAGIALQECNRNHVGEDLGHGQIVVRE
jgi:hypothetical protein